MRNSVKRIALLIESSNAYARGLIRGAFSFGHQQGNWSFFLPEQERGGTPPEWFSNWKGDGILARIETAEIAELVERIGLPVIDLSAARLCPEIPWVETDDSAIAELAAQHLLERGFRELGYCGMPEFNWSNWRYEAFAKYVQNAEARLHTFRATPVGDPAYDWEFERGRLSAWVRSLPKPIAIMACYDNMARQLLDGCHQEDLGVPEDVAVIGVDNDPLVCELSDPPLTSIETNPVRAGYLAAEMLHRLMSGESVSAEAVLVKPFGLVERLSTDSIAVEDSEVASALRLIRENATRNIRVKDIVESLGISRRKLETKFRSHLKRSPHEEIQRRRIDKVKQLLSYTDLTLGEIAKRTGFEHSEYLSVAFLRETGQKASEFRSKSRQGQADLPD